MADDKHIAFFHSWNFIPWMKLCWSAISQELADTWKDPGILICYDMHVYDMQTSMSMFPFLWKHRSACTSAMHENVKTGIQQVLTDVLKWCIIIWNIWLKQKALQKKNHFPHIPREAFIFCLWMSTAFCFGSFFFPQGPKYFYVAARLPP